MSTSLLYHAFGGRGYDYVNTKYPAGAVIFTIRQRPESLRCPCCGSRDLIRKGQVHRRLRTVPIGKKTVWFCAIIQRVHCMACNVIRQAKLGLADERRSYTKIFERYVIELSQHMTIKDIATHLNAGWDVIKDIQKRHLMKRFAKPPLKRLRQIAIDEISVKKGHRYLTIVMDLESGAVVFVGDGKGAEALTPFWKQVKSSRAKITAVAVDMSLAYVSAVQKNLPKATIVFDHFHVVKLVNDTLTDLRRDLYHQLKGQPERDVIKGTRWLLLKAPANLKKERNEKQRLEQALELNKPLATAYYLKEDLRQLWEQKTKQDAETHLIDWIWRAGRSGIHKLFKLACTIAAYRTGILAYFDHRISTGPLEGTNNKIKTMKRQAYGFRDMEFFKLKIKAIHETRYALVG